MKNPPEVRSGDRVRVEIEGTVQFVARRQSETDYVYIETGNGNFICARLTDPCVTSIGMIHPPVAVGDVLTTPDEYDRAPNSTVIRSPNTGGVFVKNDNGDWVCGCRSCDLEHRLLFAGVARTVMYVPTEATS